MENVRFYTSFERLLNVLFGRVFSEFHSVRLLNVLVYTHGERTNEHVIDTFIERTLTCFLIASMGTSFEILVLYAWRRSDLMRHLNVFFIRLWNVRFNTSYVRLLTVPCCGRIFRECNFLIWLGFLLI